MRRGELTELLLDLTCGPIAPGDGRLRALGDAQWRAIGLIAAQHRIEPILHDRLRDHAVIPAPLRRAWRDSYRYWAMKAAAAQVDLRETVALLGDAGFAPVALKGAFLTWHAYPKPALRPLRDIDILVPVDAAEDAFALLRQNGWTVPANAGEGDGKHLTPMVARCGTAIELHRRLWERPGELDHHAPGADDEAIRARAIVVDGIAYPATSDMIAHLIIHAVYSHRLDCGPLLLSDIRWLGGATSIDWGALRTRSVSEGWEPGLSLITSLCLRYFGPQFSDYDDGARAHCPPEIVTVAGELLLQDLDTRRSAGLAATAMVRGARALASRVTHGVSARVGPGARGASAPEGLGEWAGGRLRRTIGELGNPAVRDQARELSRLSKWLGA